MVGIHMEAVEALGPLAHLWAALGRAARDGPLPRTAGLPKHAEQAIALQGRLCQAVTRAHQGHALQLFTGN